MHPEDVRAFVERDWQALAEMKERAWLEHRARSGVRGAMRVADELRRQVQARQPTWPSDEERADDLASHVRVTAMLRRAAHAPPAPSTSTVRPCASSELVVTKILAGRSKDLEDVRGIVRAQGERFDRARTRALLRALEAALDQSDLVPQLDALLSPTRRGRR